MEPNAKNDFQRTNNEPTGFCAIIFQQRDMPAALSPEATQKITYQREKALTVRLEKMNKQKKL